MRTTGFAIPGCVGANATGANASANVPRPAGSSLIWQNPKSTLHNSPQCHRQPAVLADSGRRGAQCSEVKEEAEGRGTRTELSATPS